jgi:hypothetical protein
METQCKCQLENQVFSTTELGSKEDLLETMAFPIQRWEFQHISPPNNQTSLVGPTSQVRLLHIVSFHRKTPCHMESKTDFGPEQLF